MKKSIGVALPEFPGFGTLQRDEWDGLMFVVGANGTGKSRFANALVAQLGTLARLLDADRLAGFTKHKGLQYSQISDGMNIAQFGDYKNQAILHRAAFDVPFLLRNRLDVRIRVESVLSTFFGRALRLDEEGGMLKPRMSRVGANKKYDFAAEEAHGLKELIVLLTALYSAEHQLLVIDEPELHLHPQYQAFLLQQLRAVAGPGDSPERPVILLVTHSPILLDLRNAEDLKRTIVFRAGEAPASFEPADDYDKTQIARLLPRLTAHHRQVFFAERPIIVEGYRDAQLLNLIAERSGRQILAGGSCIIDAGGKDEAELLLRLTRSFGVDSKVIADFDALLNGRLRGTIAKTEAAIKRSIVTGHGDDPMVPCGQLETALDAVVEVIAADAKPSAPEWLLGAATAVQSAATPLARRCRAAIFLDRHASAFVDAFPARTNVVENALGRRDVVLDVFQAGGMYALKKGTLEEYCPSYLSTGFVPSDQQKQAAFSEEWNWLTEPVRQSKDVEERYRSLVEVLDLAAPAKVANADASLFEHVAQWIHDIQRGIQAGEIRDVESLVKSSRASWGKISRILEVESLLVHSTEGASPTFSCRVRLRPTVDPTRRAVSFTDATVPSKMELTLDGISTNQAALGAESLVSV